MNLLRLPCKTKPPLCRLGVAIAALAWLTPAFSQESPPPPAPPGPPNQSQNVTQTLSQESLNQLLAPIALYPDALIALMLPASTVPSDVVLASRYLSSNGDPNQIPNQSWDPSVQSLASYPDVLAWMDQNLEWTTTLGQAFLAQPGDVMNTIQQLRAQAKTAGNLVDTPQQKVVEEDRSIRIVPAEQDYIYPPQYDPEVVYSQPYSQDVGPLVTFGAGYAVGAWLSYDCDWDNHQVYYGQWQPGWNYHHGNGGHHGGNQVNVVNINVNTAHAWQPSQRSRQQLAQHQQNFNRSANVQTSSGFANQSEKGARQVPRPSRAAFTNNSATRNRNTERTAQRQATTSSQNSAQTSRALTPTTPPNVPGQRGKPLQNSHNPNAVPNQNNPANPSSGKHQHNANPVAQSQNPETRQATSANQTEHTQAPQNGGKHNGPHSYTQANPAPHVAQPASSTGSNAEHKNNHSSPSSPQAQSTQAPPSNKHQHSSAAPQEHSSAPQHQASAPDKHNSQHKENSKPSAAPPQHSNSGSNHQEHKAAPAPQKKAAPAAHNAAPAQKPSGKKSDKKKDDN